MSATSAETRPISGSRVRVALDRVLAAAPIAGIVLVVLTFYAIEAWTRKTPWLFSDEVEWTQLSRAIEETGHAARRGDPIYFKSLYAYLIAPLWAIHSTETAYAGIKYVNAVVMPLAAIPTYLLARMMLPKRTSIVVALLSICIPGMAYVTMIVPEALAYPWYALCSWLIVRALASGRGRDYVLAGLVAFSSVMVRQSEFTTVPMTFVLAVILFWLTGEKGRALRAGRSRWDVVGALVLLVGAQILINRVVLQHVEIWQVSTQYWKGRIVDLGLQAWLAFTVGLGVLPVIGGITSLHLRDRRDDPAYRAYTAFAISAIFFISLYTGVKSAHISTVFSTLVEERNLIYLSPLMLIGTALVFESRRLDRRLVIAASAFTAFLILFKPLQVIYPYYEAPGFAVVTLFNRQWSWTMEDLRLLLLGVFALSLVLLAYRQRRAVAAFAAIFFAAWMLTSEIATTKGFDSLANTIRASLPAQLNWLDQQVGDQPVTYLGQGITDPNGILLTEFWNRSLRNVYSLDGTAPGPGPAGTPDVISPDGELSRMPDTQYVLADTGVQLQAEVVRKVDKLTLYRGHAPWHLVDQAQQLYADGWVPGWSSYTYFTPGESGTLVLTLSRLGFNGDAPVGHARIVVGEVKTDPFRGVTLGRVWTRKSAIVRNGEQQQIRIPIEQTPFRIVLVIKPTFRASPSDPRNLGAQVNFEFVPSNGG